MKDIEREDFEHEATHATDEARMVLPGIQAILGFQLVAVFSQRFEALREAEQYAHLGAFFLTALAMGLLMTPAAYHRQVERGRVSRRFVDLASTLLSVALLPLIAGLGIDAFILVRLVTQDAGLAWTGATGVALALIGLWFGLPQWARAAEDDLGVWSQGLMVHCFPAIGRMRYGPGSSRLRHNDRGSPSSATT